MKTVSGQVVSEYHAWKVVRDTNNGFWIVNPLGNVSGFAFNEGAAVSMLDEKSGRHTNSLPVINRKDIKRVSSPRTFGFAGEWWQRDTYFIEGKEIGCIQTRRRFLGRRIGHRVETTSCAGNGCVQGGNLTWIVLQAGYRLEH